MGRHAQTVVRAGDGQHLGAALQPQVHFINRVAPGRHIIVYIDPYLRFLRRSLHIGGFPVGEDQGVIFQSEAAHAAIVHGLVSQTSLPVLKGDVDHVLAAPVQQARIAGGKHHKSIFVIA